MLDHIDRRNKFGAYAHVDSHTMWCREMQLYEIRKTVLSQGSTELKKFLKVMT